MFAMNRLALTAILFLGLSLVVTPSEGLCAGPAAAPARSPAVAPETDQAAKPAKTFTRKGAQPVLKLNKNMARDLKKLKDTQRVQVGNKEMTVRDLKKLRVTEQKKGLAKLKAMRTVEATKITALQAAFEKEEASRINAANAKVKTEMAKISKMGAARAAPTNGNGASQAIKREAAAIQNRVRGGTATPADHARVKELFQQHQQLK